MNTSSKVGVVPTYLVVMMFVVTAVLIVNVTPSNGQAYQFSNGWLPGEKRASSPTIRLCSADGDVIVDSLRPIDAEIPGRKLRRDWRFGQRLLLSLLNHQREQ